MTIPTKSDFESWLEAARTPTLYSDGLIRPLDRLEALTKQSVRELLFGLRAERRARWATLAREEPIKWLHAHDDFRQAENLVLFGRRRPTAKNSTAPDLEVWAARRADRYFLRAADPKRALGWNGEKTEDGRLRYELRRLYVDGYNHSDGWVFACASALHEYLYTENWKVSLSTSRSWADARAAARSSVSALNELLASTANFGLELRTPRSFLQRTLEKIEALPTTPVLPVTRSDVRARERLFVYRMFKANHSLTRNPKAKAIAYLMGLEGFKHQYDDRSIERLCAEFAGKYFKKKQALPPG